MLRIAGERGSADRFIFAMNNEPFDSGVIIEIRPNEKHPTPDRLALGMVLTNAQATELGEYLLNIAKGAGK